MATKLKNRLKNYPKIIRIIEKGFILIILLLIILPSGIYKDSNNIVNLDENIKTAQSAKNNDEDSLQKLSNLNIENINLDFITYTWWKENLASKASLSIYSYTSNLKMLADLSQDELDKISMSNILSVDKNNFDNIVKFIIIDKKQGTFITNDRDSINYIKNSLKQFSVENGKLFDYVSRKGKLYNISYDSNLSPNGSSGINAIENSADYVEAYWFPNNYTYSAEDYELIKSIVTASKISITKNISEHDLSINNMVSEKLNMVIHITIYIIILISIIFLLFSIGKDEVKKAITENIIVKFIILIEKWFGNRNTLFKIFFFLISIFITSVFSLLIIGRFHNMIKFIILPVLVYLILIFISLIKFCRYLDNIIKGAEIITSGDINHVIKESGDYALTKLSRNINKINKGFKVSIEDQIKNEKLKSELVANVSHDLKTPLTSIINYTDILLREDISEEEKVEFIKILNRKSLKLKTLIEDLFEISKINSGKEEIKREEVDVAELLKQAISEYSDSDLYKDKNLKFILRTYDKRISMNLDGNKMSRVFENLINNALKYSIKDTRVYVGVEDIGKGIKISFKNVSAAPLDFDKKEIFERFTRGDKSRNSDIEGNGLGLAIAKSIVELNGGLMYIDFDGDLFKVIIELYC